MPSGNLKAVDLGCGSGLFTRTLKKLRPEYEIFGCDKSKVAIEFAQKFNDGINYFLCDVTRLPFKNSFFDIAVGFDIVEHLPQPEEIFTEMRRVLKPGGLAHLFVPTEGNVLTLQWFAWKLFPKTLTTKAYGGHT